MMSNIKWDNHGQLLAKGERVGNIIVQTEDLLHGHLFGKFIASGNDLDQIKGLVEVAFRRWVTDVHSSIMKGELDYDELDNIMSKKSKW